MNDIGHFQEDIRKLRDKILSRRDKKALIGDRQGYQQDSLILNGMSLVLQRFEKRFVQE
jgi:hypothetical protein